MKAICKVRKSFLFLLLTAVLFMGSAVSAEAASSNAVTTAKNNKVSSGKWIETEKGIRYQKSNGKYVKNQWASISGKIYCFSDKGYAKTGWFTWKGNTYYATGKGAVAVKKWLTLENKKYYLKADGTRAEKEWVKKGSSYYYFKSTGVLVTDTVFSVKGSYYYVNAAGARRTNCWLTKSGKRYYFGSNGVRYANKWVKYKGKYYYLNKNGIMAKNCWISNTYYVGEDGARKVSCYVDGHYLNASGKKTASLSFSGKYIFVGDSRVVGMDAAVSGNDAKFIGKVSEGYSWLKSTAGPLLKRYLAGNEKLKVVFAFGINDLAVSSYISYYKALQKEFPTVEFYFISVNPVNDSVAASYGYLIRNSQIKSFNASLKSAMGSAYLNTYTYLVKNGFGTADGVHYTSDTYKKLYQYIIGKIS